MHCGAESRLTSMEKRTQVVVTLALLLAGFTISAAQEVVEFLVEEDIFKEENATLRLKRQTQSGLEPCRHPYFERLRKCCKTPRLMLKGTYKACKLDDGKAGNGTMNQTERFLTSSGTVDVTKLTAQFLNNSEAAWKPIIQAAITNCSAELSSASSGGTVNPTSSPGIKACSPGPALMMICIHRYSLLNCPSAGKIEGQTCNKEDIDAVKSCEPFRFLKRILKG